MNTKAGRNDSDLLKNYRPRISRRGTKLFSNQLRENSCPFVAKTEPIQYTITWTEKVSAGSTPSSQGRQ